MGHFGNSRKMIVKAVLTQEKMYDFKTAEEVQLEVLRLFKEGAKAYAESNRQMKISKELTSKALMICIQYNLLEKFATMRASAFNEMLMEELKKHD